MDTRFDALERVNCPVALGHLPRRKTQLSGTGRLLPVTDRSIAVHSCHSTILTPDVHAGVYQDAVTASGLASGRLLHYVDAKI
jgi:hypothetical protein